MVDENVTIADDIANIGRQALCSNETLRDALAVITSVEIVCGECG